ncbi:xanthine dehydrogenase family protein molybdopterin-binding subunit [Oceanimonas sp. MB9]|uniref:xanthine dehydrogenase family protein molybdopterin-binding subunit n=1 Tax=Oceanimonas sp. MB9 TaxID=2588453 RepID=UPI0013F61C88|nr:molybdopterin cofactor-binding domain-containing protein [Oceanimonas sp. MB9]NHI02122.1 Membrane-bound aldehyde dehydrogenase [pyrroloquinoline-quinone] [Oceanimonas sp. MB9]
MNSLKAKKDTIDLSRRSFLIGTVHASVMMAFAPAIFSSALSAQEALSDKMFSPTIWFEMDAQGNVMINIAKAEMGQHIGTALARILADELACDWDKVTIRHVDTDPKWGYMVTGGSWSIFHSYKPLSQAGAAGRLALIDAGAKLLGVSAEQCEARDGKVFHGDRSVSYGDIVTRGELNRVFTAEEIAELPIKPSNKRHLIGKPSRALDIPAKTNGTAVYGIDVEVEGMVYARPILPPTRYGSTVERVDDSAARDIKGYLGYEVLKDPSKTCEGWVTVIADNFPSAIKAANAIKVDYKAGETATVSEADLQKEGERLVRDRTQGLLFVDEGDVTRAQADSGKTIEALYTTATASHFQLEPLNALSEFRDGKWHVHTGNQWQSLTLPTIAKAAGVSEDDVIMHQYYLGGGFGRRLYGDWIVPSLLTAKAIDKPVKLIFTREDDTLFDQSRSASTSLFHASFDDNGNFTGLEHAFAAGWPTLTMAPGFMADSVDKKGKIDMFSASGADHWYSMANHRARAINNELAQKTFTPGWLRAVGQGWIVWGLESFIDEIAVELGKDPAEFRLALLDGAGKQAGKAPESVGGAKRLHNTLAQLKAKVADIKLEADEGIGFSVSAGQERTMPAWIATAAHVHVNRQSGKITVKKLWAVVDAGIVIHPDGALAQIEGSLLWGTSLALFEHNAYQDGRVSKTNLHSYLPLRMNDLPEMDIEFIESDEFPVGLGEPGVIGVAPAIGNAVYQAVGIRLRELPMLANHVLNTLAVG